MKTTYKDAGVDNEASDEVLALAQSTFGDILSVGQKTMWWWTLGMTWTLINLRGLEQMMMDMYDHPDELHQLMSILRDGHLECCGVRRLRPLRRVLTRFDAWVTGKRRSGRPADDLPVAQRDRAFQGASGALLRLHPLAGWSRVDVFDYARRHGVPTHPLHEKGYVRIGCAPCVRPRGEAPAEPDRWWWEQGSAGREQADPGSGI